MIIQKILVQGKQTVGRNSLAVKCSFGSGKSGCIGTVYNNTRFRSKSGHDWIVPLSWGGFFAFSNGAMLTQKKQLFSEFTKCEKDCNVVKTCEELLKGQLIEAINENFILEFKDDLMNYDSVSLTALVLIVPGPL